MTSDRMIIRFLFCLLLLLPSPLLAGWRVAETAHFRVFAEMSETRLRERAAVLEDFRALLDLATTGQVAEGQPRLDVFLVDQLASTFPFDRMQPGPAGYYSAGSRGIGAFALADDAGLQILLHEYAHHHMFSASRRRYPPWYVEGFAEYFSTARFQPDRIEFGQAPDRIGRLLAFRQISWRQVLTADNRQYKGLEAGIFYAKAWALTHYMFRKPGLQPKLQAYLAAVTAGEDSVVAFTRHVADPDTLDAAIPAYLASKDFTFSQIRRQPVPAAAISVRALPASADMLLLPYASLNTRGPAASDQAKALRAVRTLTDRFPDDALALRTRAMAELFWGDKAKALALVEAGLANAPDDAELLRLQGQAMLAIDRDANRGAARRVLSQAISRDPTDWRAMALLVGTHDLIGSLIPGSLFQTVETMWSLAPQVSGPTISMAIALVRRDRLAEAAAVLEPLAFAPHRPVPLIRSLYDAAKAGDRTGFERLLTGGSTVR